MKHFFAVSMNQEACEAIKPCFQSEYKVDVATNMECFWNMLNMFKKKHYEFLFIDVDILQKGTASINGHTNYKNALQPFWQVSPNVEIVVMSSQENTREAVKAVKAGARNYITYPVDIDELRYVVESTYEVTMMQSELNYLRDKFWQIDSLEVVKTFR